MRLCPVWHGGGGCQGPQAIKNVAYRHLPGALTMLTMLTIGQVLTKLDIG